MLFDRIGGAEVANAEHLSARSVAMHRQNLSESRRQGAVAVMESKLAPL